MVAVVAPFAGTEMGDKTTVETEFDTGPAVKVTVAVWVTVTESVESAAVNTGAPAKVEVRLKVTVPVALVTAVAGVM